jgi:hypothetical protein
MNKSTLTIKTSLRRNRQSEKLDSGNEFICLGAKVSLHKTPSKSVVF